MTDLNYGNYPFPGESSSPFLRQRVDRREFLRRTALLTGGSVLGLSLLGGLACQQAAPTAVPTLAPTPGPGETVSPADSRIQAGAVEFAGEGGRLLGYFSQPAGPGPHPGVLVIHENRGLQPHFPDVTRRLALEGYAALAVDLLSRSGGTGQFATSDEARDALRELNQDQFLQDLNSSVAYLQGLPQVRAERLGAMGFCFGGGMVWLLSVRNQAIRASVPYYGSAPPLEEVPNLEGAVLGIYAGEDERINAGVPDLEAALQAQGKEYRFITYPGAAHAFFNDTGNRYHPQAAGEAWGETLQFFQRQLKS